MKHIVKISASKNLVAKLKYYNLLRPIYDITKYSGPESGKLLQNALIKLKADILNSANEAQIAQEINALNNIVLHTNIKIPSPRSGNAKKDEKIIETLPSTIDTSEHFKHQFSDDLKMISIKALKKLKKTYIKETKKREIRSY